MGLNAIRKRCLQSRKRGHEIKEMVKSRLFVKSKALLSRLLYLSHGVLSVAMALKYHGGHLKYWFLFVPILALVVESVLMLRKKNWEFR